VGVINVIAQHVATSSTLPNSWLCINGLGVNVLQHQP
jgi:hypothetical protein